MGLLAVMDRENSGARTKFSELISAGKAIKFFCLFVFVYFLLMAVWPVLGPVYSEFYRSAGEFLFGSFGRGNVVRFSKSDNIKYDICITVFNRQNLDENGEIQGSQFYHSIHYGDYMHIAFLTALIAATPLPLKRRGWALVWALILMHAFIALKLAIIIFSLFNIALGKNTELADRNIVLAEHITTGFVIAFFIWVLVSFRSKDLVTILKRISTKKNSSYSKI
jgi:hypothetical protein